MRERSPAYSVTVVTGTIAAGLAANAELMQLRWTHASRLCVIESVRVWAGSIVAFTAGFTQVDLMFARAFTADGTGGGVATLTTNNGKRRTVGQATTSLGSIRIATTAALGAGTKTLDAQPLGSTGGSVVNVAGTPVVPITVLTPPVEAQPIVLAQNEGLSIRATVPATGTWTMGVDIHWSEADAV